MKHLCLILSLALACGSARAATSRTLMVDETGAILGPTNAAAFRSANAIPGTGDVAQVAADLLVVSGAVDQVETDALTLSSRVDQVEIDLAALEPAAIGELSNRVDQLEADLGTVSGAVDQVEEDVAVLQTNTATAAQGSLADTALQPGDSNTNLTNDAGYLTAEMQTFADVMALGNGAGGIAITNVPYITSGATNGANSWINIQAGTINYGSAAYMSFANRELFREWTTTNVADAANEIVNWQCLTNHTATGYQPLDADLTTLAGNDAGSLTNISAANLTGNVDLDRITNAMARVTTNHSVTNNTTGTNTVTLTWAPDAESHWVHVGTTNTNSVIELVFDFSGLDYTNRNEDIDLQYDNTNGISTVFSGVDYWSVSGALTNSHTPTLLGRDEFIVRAAFGEVRAAHIRWRAQ